VLTAAQMTSLQQTAMGGGEATAKTASYVLTAADAGTTVIMNAAGATTITVNTALFAAGDTVNIQNIGAGICTVTAGTATVNTAGSLALNQYEGGVLYFRSTSASTFFDYVQTGSVSPLTTKGDLYGFSTLDARIPIGTNDQVLTADSAQALGLKWATPAAPSRAITLVSTTTMSGATHTVSGLSGDTFSWQIVDATNNTAGANISFRINADSGSNYAYSSFSAHSYSTYVSNYMSNQSGTTGGFTSMFLGLFTNNTGSKYSGYGTISGGTTASAIKLVNAAGNPDTTGSGTSGKSAWMQGSYTSGSAISSISFIVNSGAFNGGTLLIYKG
jgi:hypothetical protein